MIDGEQMYERKMVNTGGFGARNLHALFNALGDARRLFIFQLLLDERQFCVSDIAKECDISVPAASQQLRVLERAGLVVRRRNGQRICYNVNKNDVTIQSLVPLL